ncbi:class F sortase [Streptomyces sp. NPDC048664]|uniref:class F sortase n=1 Tax=Streptomyces sp. NPDC048664 TaxID=3154505 RepID=UPI0034246329
MALTQSTVPGETRSRPTTGRALLWPAAAVGLGALLIHHSLSSPEDLKPPTPPTAVAQPADIVPPSQTPPPVDVTPPAVAPAATDGASPSAVVPPMANPARPVPNGATQRALWEPKRLLIPTIGVNAPFMGLSLAATGQLNAPPVNNTNLVGWYQDGVVPGQRGASIVVGHVDTKTGPAVFVLLRFLKAGSQVRIDRADGSVARFKVDSVETFSKANFPDDRVYGATSTSQLRLITCGGIYNHTAHDYESNVVVFAHLDSVEEPAVPSLPPVPTRQPSDRLPQPFSLVTRQPGPVPQQPGPVQGTPRTDDLVSLPLD